MRLAHEDRQRVVFGLSVDRYSVVFCFFVDNFFDKQEVKYSLKGSIFRILP